MTRIGLALDRRRLVRYALYLTGILVLCVALAGLWFWNSLYRGIPDLPPTAQLWEAGREPAVEFLDVNGETLAIRGPRYGRAVRVADLPDFVPQAFLAAEDKRFYEHDGADTRAMARAAWANWRSGQTVSGASTITQQLIKNLVLSPEQTLRRKAQEVRLAQALEERLSKDEILELYLNRVYFGAGAYGLGAASRVYFNVSPEDMTLSQASLLATLPKAPSRLALSRDLEAARARQAYVLREMVDAGFVTQADAEAARAEPVTLAERAREDRQLGYVLDLAADHVARLLPTPPADLIVTLTIDPQKQAQVQEVLLSKFKMEAPESGASQLAAVVFDKGGALVAMVGGTDYATSAFNRATQAARQPGSAFKALVYAAALEAGYEPYDVVYDEPVAFGDWTPQNYARGQFLGPVTVSESLAKSLNTVAATLGHEIGEDRIIATAKRFGIAASFKPLPSIALGSQEVTLWDITRAFGVFMSAGTRLDPYLVVKVETSRGDVVFERPEYETASVYPAALARQMNAMLARVVQSGTGTAAQLDRWVVAGKTGTSQDWRDAWFIGYTSQFVAGVWVGNDNDTPMNEVTGGGLPAQLWHEAMTVIHANLAPARLAGAEAGVTPTEAVERRITYYRALSQAFKTVESQQSGASRLRTSQRSQ